MTYNKPAQCDLSGRKDRPSIAMFRHIPNDSEGEHFLKLLKKYRHTGSFTMRIRYRQPRKGYSYGGYSALPQHKAQQFSIYTDHGAISWRDSYWSMKDRRDKLQRECNSLNNSLATSEEIAEENYNNRCDWRNSYYEVIQSSFWFWFKLRYAPFGRYLFRKLTFWRNHYA